MQHRQPIYKRIEEEIKKKELKILDIKSKAEEERRQKLRELGQLGEEEIVEAKRQKDIRLKGAFNIESFEEKYERDIKQLFEKQRRREQERVDNERLGCSFTPLVKPKRGEQLQHMEKSHSSHLSQSSVTRS